MPHADADMSSPGSDSISKGLADEAPASFAVRPIESPREFFEIPQMRLASIMAEAINTLRTEKLRPLLHRDVRYESHWAKRTFGGPDLTMLWLSGKFAQAQATGGYLAQVVVTAGGNAAVLSHQRATGADVLVTIETRRNLISRVVVATEFDRDALRELRYFPPEA